jgi:hypothetical protein
MARSDDAECDRILAVTSAEIAAHCAANGIDRAKIEDEFERMLGAAKVEAYRRRMRL